MKNVVLCLSLFCIIGVSVGQYRRSRQLAGGFSDIIESELKQLEPKVGIAFGLISYKHDDFVYKLKRVVSGKSQVVAGSRYQFVVEAAPKDNADDVKKCDVDILENLQGEFDDIQVKCEHKEKVFSYKKE